MLFTVSMSFTSRYGLICFPFSPLPGTGLLNNESLSAIIFSNHVLWKVLTDLLKTMDGLMDIGERRVIINRL